MQYFQMLFRLVSKLKVPGFERLHEPSASLRVHRRINNMPASDALRMARSLALGPRQTFETKPSIHSDILQSNRVFSLPGLLCRRIVGYTCLFSPAHAQERCGPRIAGSGHG